MLVSRSRPYGRRAGHDCLVAHALSAADIGPGRERRRLCHGRSPGSRDCSKPARRSAGHARSDIAGPGTASEAVVGSGDRSCMFRTLAAAVSSAKDPSCDGRDRQDTDDHERNKPAAIVTRRQPDHPHYGHRRQDNYCCCGSDHLQRPPFRLRLRPGFWILRWALDHDRDLPPPWAKLQALGIARTLAVICWSHA